MLKRSPALNGIQVQLVDLGWYCLGVLGIIVTFAIVIASLVVIWSVIRPASAREPLVLWQLGACMHQPGDRPACITLGSLLPQDVCMAMRRRLIVEGFPGRPVCARVLVDVASD